MATPDAAVPRLIVVDDTDPTIQYSPSSAFSLDTKGSLNGLGWGGNVFNQTITGTTVNASFSYTFNGTFVRVMVAAKGPEGECSCSVDGHTIASFPLNPSHLTNQIACDSAGSLQGTTAQHTLNVDFSFPANTTGQPLWLDSIQYQPVPSDPLDYVTLRIHNSDPSVTYANSSGGWISFPELQINVTETNGTSMDFAFNGSSVTLYAVVINSITAVQYNANTAFYSLDRGNSTSFDLPSSMRAATTGNYSDILNYPLFTVSDLSASPHDIEVVTSYNSSIAPQYLSIEYFVIKTNPYNSSSSEQTPGNSSSSNNGSSPSSSSVSSHKTIGAIVGGTVAGVAALIVLFFLIFWFVRRQKERKYSNRMLGSGPGYDRSNVGDCTLQVTPFDYGSRVVPTNALKSPASLQESTTFMGQSPTYNPYTDYNVAALLAGPPSGQPADSSAPWDRISGWNPNQFLTTNMMDPIMLPVQNWRNEIRQHLDSGVRIALADDAIVDVPPTYSEV